MLILLLDNIVSVFIIKFSLRMHFSLVSSSFPAGKRAIISQSRVWPFPFTTIVTFGERNRNPGHRFAGSYFYHGHFSLKEYAMIHDIVSSLPYPIKAIRQSGV